MGDGVLHIYLYLFEKISLYVKLKSFDVKNKFFDLSKDFNALLLKNK